MSERDIFMALLDLSTADERAKYLDEACGGDADLRQRVEKLFGSHEAAGSFLDLTPADAATRAFSPDPACADTRTGGAPWVPDEVALGFLARATRPDSLGRIAHYEVLEVLGRGGFGIVFRAFDDTLERVVAVKVLAPQLAVTSPARKRFLREARTSAAVRHENVVQVYEVGEEPLPYLVMEFIPGETLQQRLDRVGPVEPAEVVRVGRQLAEGLAAAHATDLIHRDVKPGNILLEGGTGRVKITDFGLARAADDASISQSGIIAGTPMYMAPEQAMGEKLDQRADLFSLGSVLYQMAAGRPPFRADCTVAVLRRVADDTPRDIREVIPETPQWLCDIIARLHAKNPDDRYRSAREVADVLADCEARLAADPKLRDSGHVPCRTPSRSGRRKWVAAVGAAVLFLPAIALAVMESTGVTHLFRGSEPAGGTDPGRGSTPVAQTEPVSNSAVPETVPVAGFREIHGADRAAFDLWLGDMKRARYLPDTIAAWSDARGEPRYAAAARNCQDLTDWEVIFSAHSDDRQGRGKTLRNQGYQPVIRAVCLSGAELHFVDLWVKSKGQWRGGIFSGGRQMLEARLEAHRAGSLKPFGHSVAPSGQRSWVFAHVYAADEGVNWQVEENLNKATLRTVLDTRRANHWRLESLAVYGLGVQSLFIAQFVQDTNTVQWSASLDLNTAEYEQELAKQRKLGFWPKQVTAREFGGTTRYSVIWELD